MSQWSAETLCCWNFCCSEMLVMVGSILGCRRAKVSFWLVLVGLGPPFYSELASILLAGVIHFVAIECGARTDHGNFLEDLLPNNYYYYCYFVLLLLLLSSCSVEQLACCLPFFPSCSCHPHVFFILQTAPHDEFASHAFALVFDDVLDHLFNSSPD